jgi:hypothetical protein
MFDINHTLIAVVWEAGKNYRGSGVTSYTDNPQKWPPKVCKKSKL